MANYDLKANGPTDLARYTSLLDLKRITRDPLSGVLDSSNVIFNTNFSPCLSSGSTVVYLGTAVQTGYTFIYDTGEIQLASAPSVQPTANYTASTLTSEVITKLLFLGFDEMESRWARGFRLSNSTSSYTAAAESDTNVYIVPSTVLTDPTSSSWYFSQSRLQIAFFMKCCQYAYFSMNQFEASMAGMSYREAGGMAVNTAGRAKDMEKLLVRLDKELNKLLMTVQANWLASAGGFASFIPPEHSLDYDSSFQWRASQNATGGAL